MNYRHAFHAGNFADVAKHLAFVAILLHLRRKEQAFAVIDTHAGRGLYDLKSEAARRTGEAESGIGRLWTLRKRGAELPQALQRYLDVVAATGDAVYPGSPLIAARLLRPQDRFVGIEKQADEYRALRAALAPFADQAVRCECADGYARLSALLPPPERRGVVLIDPPFESDAEFEMAAQALGQALKRFATGIYLLWFPLKSVGEAHAFAGELAATGAHKVLRIALDVGTAARAGEKERLTAAGLLVVNPPFGLAGEMQAALAIVAPLLSPQAQFDIRWLAGGES
jgi:23S rRNA (adenine2030-N6)-methyltransferase